MEIINNILVSFSEKDLVNGVLVVPEGVTEIQLHPEYRDNSVLNKKFQ